VPGASRQRKVYEPPAPPVNLSEERSHTQLAFHLGLPGKMDQDDRGQDLATTYGIVTQSRGFISVDSEVGRGTTFTIYLPATTELVEQALPPPMLPQQPGGTETVLLVEDAPAVRAFVARALNTYGYTVLRAANGDEALQIAAVQPFDLLLTDVILPHMNGRQLAKRVASLRPAMKVLFMSGYTGEAIVHHGVLDSGVSFLQKPITPDALALKIREVLDTTASCRDDVALLTHAP
jgi:CheY-like chemotaxis protein